MGQAKRRGTREQRIAQACQIQKAQEPLNIPCKTCGLLLNDFIFLQSTPAGAAWQKQCACGAITTALVQAKDSTLPRTFKKTLAFKQAIVGDDNNKVSVSFLEKNIDTVETGCIRLN